MQDLPIAYFDTHQHGDIMSYYTNDIDTLRMLISQSLPTFIQSGTIVLVVFAIMLYFSVWMTLVLVVGVVAMFFVTKVVGGGSARYFVKQQKSLADTEKRASSSSKSSTTSCARTAAGPIPTPTSSAPS